MKTINISTDDAVNLNCNAVSSPTENAPVVTQWMKNGILIRSFQGIQQLFILSFEFKHPKVSYILKTQLR